jgi:hypothetical protein
MFANKTCKQLVACSLAGETSLSASATSKTLVAKQGRPWSCADELMILNQVGGGQNSGKDIWKSSLGFLSLLANWKIGWSDICNSLSLNGCGGRI